MGNLTTSHTVLVLSSTGIKICFLVYSGFPNTGLLLVQELRPTIKVKDNEGMANSKCHFFNGCSYSAVVQTAVHNLHPKVMNIPDTLQHFTWCLELVSITDQISSQVAAKQIWKREKTRMISEVNHYCDNETEKMNQS